MQPAVWILLVTLINVPEGHGQSVQMDPEVSGFVGSTVELSCLFINSKPPVKISQVTWQKSFNGTKQNVAIANPALGVSVLPAFKDRVSFKHLGAQSNPSLEDTTIVFSNLRLSDEAAYICEYTTFPAGNRENMVNLTVYARPMTHMTLTTPIIIARPQKHKMTVATCLSANGKPPSVIKWDTKLNGEAMFQETRNPNGTVTTRSSYVIVPSRECHRQKLTCIVTYNNEHFSDSVVLNVQYEPEVKIEGFDGNWYLNRQDVKLTCDADANPAVTSYHWKLSNGSMPKNVEIRNNTLVFRGPVTYDFSGTYICDATNSIGTRSGQVEVNVTELPSHIPRDNDGNEQKQTAPSAALWGGVGAVVVLVIGVALLIYFLRRRQRTFKGDYSTKKHVFGNGYSKAGPVPAHPNVPKNLQYPDDPDDEKKASQIGGPGSFEGTEHDFDGNSEDLKRPYFTVDEEKPLAQGPPGGVLGILGIVVVFGLIVGVMVTIYTVYKRGQKTRTETDNDLTEMPPVQKTAPPPPKKNSDMKGGLISDDIQVVLLDKDNEMLKLPLHPPYSNKMLSESTAFNDKPSFAHMDCDVQYAVLDTAALASSPRSSVHSCGDLVEYATIQPSSH